MTIIPRGVDCEYFDLRCVDQSQVEKLRGALGGDPEDRIVLCVGRLSATKGQAVLLRALAEARSRGERLRSVIIGRGSVRETRRLRRLAAALGLADSTHFIDHQDNIREYYALADVVVLASEKPESFGRVVAEAMAMECPVVATAHGGVLDLIADGDTGLLFPPGDVGALADCLLRVAKLPATNRRAVISSNFTLQTMVAATLAVYRRVLSPAAGSTVASGA